MGGNGRGGRGTVINRGSGGDGVISTVDASITWAKTNPTTDPPASSNGESSQSGVFYIGCATTTLNAITTYTTGDTTITDPVLI